MSQVEIHEDTSSKSLMNITPSHRQAGNWDWCPGLLPNRQSSLAIQRSGHMELPTSPQTESEICGEIALFFAHRPARPHSSERNFM